MQCLTNQRKLVERDPMHPHCTPFDSGQQRLLGLVVEEEAGFYDHRPDSM